LYNGSGFKSGEGFGQTELNFVGRLVFNKTVLVIGGGNTEVVFVEFFVNGFSLAKC